MASRVVEVDSAMAFLWALSCFVQISINIGRFPIIVGIGILFLGIVIAVILGIVLPRRTLRGLERKGEFRTPISIIIILIGAVFVVASVLLLVSNLSIDILRLTQIFISPFAAIFFALRAFLFRRWEKKNGKWIMAATWSAKYYVQPKTQQSI